MRAFIGGDIVPDATTLLGFRHLLEEHDLSASKAVVRRYTFTLAVCYRTSPCRSSRSVALSCRWLLCIHPTCHAKIPDAKTLHYGVIRG